MILSIADSLLTFGTMLMTLSPNITLNQLINQMRTMTITTTSKTMEVAKEGTPRASGAMTTTTDIITGNTETNITTNTTIIRDTAMDITHTKIIIATIITIFTRLASGRADLKFIIQILKMLV